MNKNVNVFEIKARLRRNSYIMDGMLSTGVKGAIIGAMTKICKSDQNRRIVLGWLFDYDEPPLVEKSTHKLTDGQWCALNYWVDFKDKFEPSDQFQTELAFVTLAALSAADATEKDYQKVKGDSMSTEAVTLGGVVKEINDDA